MGFNMSFHEYTCPTINRSIKTIKDEIRSILEYFKEVEGIDGNAISDCVEEIYESAFENHIEEIRSTNSELRASADKVIEGLEEEIKDLKMKVYDLEEDNDSLKQELSSLEKINSELDDKIYDLENN